MLGSHRSRRQILPEGGRIDAIQTGGGGKLKKFYGRKYKESRLRKKILGKDGETLISSGRLGGAI